jgi:hypothetical protein
MSVAVGPARRLASMESMRFLSVDPSKPR